MLFPRIALPAALAAGLLLLPSPSAQAQPYYPCHPFPLFWPVCAAGAIVGTAGAIVTAPFRAPYYYPYYGQPYYYPPTPAYYGYPYGPRPGRY